MFCLFKKTNWIRIRARIFKLLRTSGIDSMDSISYNLSPLSVIMEQETPQQCPLNVINIRVFRGHCSIYSMGAGKFVCKDSILGSYSIPGIDFYPLNPSKNLASESRRANMASKSKDRKEGGLYPDSPKSLDQDFVLIRIYWKLLSGCYSEGIERLIKGQAILRSYDLAPRPYTLPHLSRQLARPATHRKTERQLAGRRRGKGAGVEPNHTTARKPGLPYIIQSPLLPLVHSYPALRSPRGFLSHVGYWTGHEDYYDHSAQELYGDVVSARLGHSFMRRGIIL